MMSLKACAEMRACDVLPEAEIKRKLEVYPLWTTDQDGNLSRTFETKNFEAAMDFLVKVAAVSEQRRHHPDIHLTRYRHVELVLYTFSVDGVTLEDFKLAEALDAIPVDYSQRWRDLHADVVALPGHRVMSKIPPHLPPRDENSRVNDRVSVHSSRYTDEGELLHENDFLVHMGESTLLGRGEAPPHQITSTPGPGGAESYETETEHTNEQSLSSLHPVDHTQHGPEGVGRGASWVPVSLPVSPAVWTQMAAALKDLISRGYKVGESEAYLSMLEAHAIDPYMEGDVFRFYQHLQQRVTPAWMEREPEEVVATVRQFLQAYETLKGITAEEP